MQYYVASLKYDKTLFQHYYCYLNKHVSLISRQAWVVSSIYGVKISMHPYQKIHFQLIIINRFYNY